MNKFGCVIGVSWNKRHMSWRVQRLNGRYCIERKLVMCVFIWKDKAFLDRIKSFTYYYLESPTCLHQLDPDIYSHHPVGVEICLILCISYMYISAAKTIYEPFYCALFISGCCAVLLMSDRWHFRALRDW